MRDQNHFGTWQNHQPVTRIRNRRATPILSAAVLAVGMIGSAHPAMGATDSWDGGGGDNNFKSGANWVSGVAPTPGDVLLFDGASRGTPNNNFAANTVFNGISFASTASLPFTLSGNAMSLAGDLTDNTAAFLQAINLNLKLLQAPTVSVASNGTLSLAGIISGSFGLNEIGTGTLVLSGPNTFSGPITVGTGVGPVRRQRRKSRSQFRQPGRSPCPADIVLASGGTLRTTATFALNANRGIALGPGTAIIDVAIGHQTLSYAGVIANNTGGTGSLIKYSFGTLALSGANAYSGATMIKNGTANLDFTVAGAPTSNILPSSTPLTLGGATAGLGNTSSFAALIRKSLPPATDSQTVTNGTIVRSRPQCHSRQQRRRRICQSESGNPDTQCRRNRKLR